MIPLPFHPALYAALSSPLDIPRGFLINLLSIIIMSLSHLIWIDVYLVDLWVVMMVMVAMHGVVRMMLMMVVLVVMKATLGAEGLWVGSGGRASVGERGWRG